ncbi:MAG: dTDP-4-dehydrorhamnose 3,5-epimerase family protein [Myxococcota bacterium]
MRVHTTSLAGVHELELEPIYDERGYFARLYDREQFLELGLPGAVAQTSLSHNPLLGTLRGLHWQAAPGLETKLVRAIRGRAYDVVVDLRPDSISFGQWQAFELSASEGRGLFIPPRCAHGFMTLEPDTQILYQMSEAYRPELVRALRWDDPDLAISWPIAPRSISPGDAACPYMLRHIRRSLAA